jgi:hypothetical protein
MPEIYVDADACPVKDEVIRVAERFGVGVHMVGNEWMRAGLHPLVTSVVVEPKPDAADDWIARHIAAGDIAVTADIPLAARCLDAGAAVLGPTGRPFTEADIGMALAMRDLKAHLRETGEDRGFNRGFSRQDRSRFLSTLDEMLRKAV